MLSKCANPECSEIFRYLHQGKIFCLAPTPEIEVAAGMPNPVLEERFWLCERCAKEMTLIWGGAQVTLVRLPTREAAIPQPRPPMNGIRRRRRRPRPRARATSAGREDV